MIGPVSRSLESESADGGAQSVVQCSADDKDEHSPAVSKMAWQRWRRSADNWNNNECRLIQTENDDEDERQGHFEQSLVHSCSIRMFFQFYTIRTLHLLPHPHPRGKCKKKKKEDLQSHSSHSFIHSSIHSFTITQPLTLTHAPTSTSRNG